MRDILSGKQKAMFWGIMAVLVFMVVSILYMMIRSLNPPASLGSMEVKSSGESIIPYTNVLKEVANKKETAYKAVKLEDIEASLPLIAYDGEDITVSYEKDKDMLDDFTFTMYDENLEPLYEDSKKFSFPEKEGTYIVRTVFSWGYTKKNCITTENFYKIYFSEESLSVEHEH